MKRSSVYAALSNSLLFPYVFARYGLNPDSIPLLTRTFDYTFHSICDDYHNPVPTPLFDEQQGLAKTIFGVTNDLYSFLMGYSVDADHASNNKEPDTIRGHNALREPLREKQRGSDLVQSLIDEMIQNTRRSELLESQVVVAKGPVRDIISEREPIMHRYASDNFNCPKFRRDLFDFSESFKVHTYPLAYHAQESMFPITSLISNPQNMTYAISEKCYRQCNPETYYGTVGYAVYRLQATYERHFSG
ncbi:MAG: hypothetical protein Q9172_003736, partial [Xanthocarpia lactea]